MTSNFVADSRFLMCTVTTHHTQSPQWPKTIYICARIETRMTCFNFRIYMQKYVWNVWCVADAKSLHRFEYLYLNLVSSHRSLTSRYFLFFSHLFSLSWRASTVTSNRIGCAVFGHGYLCYRNYRNSAIPFSLCCASSRSSFCIGTITSPCWSTHGSRTLNTHRRPDGSLWWIIACIRSCTRTMRYAQWATNHLVSLPWSSHRCN